jgi:hypothetical protein
MSPFPFCSVWDQVIQILTHTFVPFVEKGLWDDWTVLTVKRVHSGYFVRAETLHFFKFWYDIAT